MADRPSQCAQADRWMQKALDSTLTPAERDSLDRHMETCPACVEIWQQHRELSRLATGWARRPSLAEEGTDEFVAEILSRIKSRPARGTSWRARPWAAALSVALALVLLAVVSSLVAPDLPGLPAAPPAPTFSPLPIPPDSSTLLPHAGLQSVRDWIVQDARSLPAAADAAWDTLSGVPVALMPALVALGAGLLLAALLATQSAFRRRLT